MHNFGVTSAPSPRSPGRAWARRYLLFEGWTWSDSETAARRRASWPTWRRAVRPIGAVAYWVGWAVALILQPSWRTPDAPLRAFYIALYVIVGGCVLLGIIDGFRQRRIDRSHTRT
jgi:hypothetical protein